MALCRAIQPIEGFGRLRLADEQFLECRVAPGTHPGQAVESPIAIENGTPRADNLQGIVHPVRYGLEQFGFSGAIGQAQEAGHQAQHENHAGHSEQSEQAEHDGFGTAAALQGQRTQPCGNQEPQSERYGASPVCAHNGKHSRGCVAQCLDFCHAAEP